MFSYLASFSAIEDAGPQPASVLKMMNMAQEEHRSLYRTSDLSIVQELDKVRDTPLTPYMFSQLCRVN